jgi:uncharacterized RDD family membrane protein YckC
MQDLLTDLDTRPMLAPIFKRWLACVIDYVLFFAGMIGLQYSLKGLLKFSGNSSSGGLLLILFTFLMIHLLPWLLFLPGMETFKNGQTIGKMLLGVRTVKQDGTKLNFGNSLVRHLFAPVDYFPFFGVIGLIVASNNKEKQRVGDMVEKTIVVEARG